MIERSFTRIRLHMFIATMCGIFGWYMAVDTLPRKNWIPEYWAKLTDAIQSAPDLNGFQAPQTGFFYDNPIISVEPNDKGYVVIVREASERRCTQFTTVPAIRQNVQKIEIGGGSCDGDINTVRLHVLTEIQDAPLPPMDHDQPS